MSHLAIKNEHAFTNLAVEESKIQKLFNKFIRSIKQATLVMIGGALLFVYIMAVLLILERFGAPLPTTVENVLKKVEFSAWVSAKEAQYQTDKWRHIK